MARWHDHEFEHLDAGTRDRVIMGYARTILTFIVCDVFLFSLAGGSIVSVAQDGSGIIFEDSLRNHLESGWSWVREDPAAHRITGEALELQTRLGTLWGVTNTAKNILLRTPPERPGGFSVEVTLRSDPAIDGEQAGLIIYWSDRDYIKLVKEFKGKPQVIFVREQDDKPVVIATADCPAGAVALSMVVSRGRVKARFRADHDPKWHLMGECDPLQEPPSVGLFTHVWPGASDRWAKFSTFCIRSG